MSVQLLVLRGVPEDEAEEIREILRSARVDFYETPEGNWGISLPAIWLRDETDLNRARQLLDDYQTQRAESARDEFTRQSAVGAHKGFLGRLKEEPLRILLYLAIVAAVLYFSTMPFLLF
jgi:hypothetical protein